MKFTEHRDPSIHAVKHYQPGEVKINNEVLKNSCFLNQKELVKDWSCQHISLLNTDLLDELLSLQPEVIILGTGETQIFPEPRLFAYCSQQGVGLEVMNNLAACRTYNVLTTEDREVVLGLIIDMEA